MHRLVRIDLTKADIDLFEEYEALVLPLIEKHGGYVKMRARAVDQTSETHLIFFPDNAAFQAYAANPERLAARHIWDKSKASSIVSEVEIVE